MKRDFAVAAVFVAIFLALTAHMDRTDIAIAAAEKTHTHAKVIDHALEAGCRIVACDQIRRP